MSNVMHDVAVMSDEEMTKNKVQLKKKLTKEIYYMFEHRHNTSDQISMKNVRENDLFEVNWFEAMPMLYFSLFYLL